MTGARRARGKGAGEAPKTFVSWVAEPSSSFARHRGTAGEGAVWGRGSLGCGPHNCCCWKPGGGWGAGLGAGAVAGFDQGEGGWRGHGAERTKGGCRWLQEPGPLLPEVC